MKCIIKFPLLVFVFLFGACSSDEDYEILSENGQEENIDAQEDNDNPNDSFDEVFGPISDDDLAILSSTLDLPASLLNYDVTLPNSFLDNQLNQEDNTPNNNPVTNTGAMLGRVLFYDERLSANNTVSCASCHLQENGFSDPGRLSVGFEGGLTARNSMGLANARFYGNGNFFWDERAATLEEQVLQPIQDTVEMGLSLEELQSKLSAESYYAVLLQISESYP